MYLECRLTENKTIKFKLDESNSVALRYAQLVSQIRASSISSVAFTNYFMWTKSSYPSDSYKASINESIDYFNENNDHGVEVKFLTELSKENLNQLQFEVERAANLYLPLDLLSSDLNTSLDETHSDYLELSQLTFHLSRIYDLIQDLNSSLNLSDTSFNSYFSSYMKDLINPNLTIPLDEEDYQLFTLDAQFGDLFLGYGTNGKNLFHIFKDKDFNFFREGNNPAPQRTITSNFMAWFSDDKAHQTQLDPYLNWYSKVDTADYPLDLSDPLNAIGYIKIGEFVTPEILKDKDRKAIVEHYSGLDILDFYITC